MKYAEIGETLRDKILHDVAFKFRWNWMMRKVRKKEASNQMKKLKDIKTKTCEITLEVKSSDTIVNNISEGSTLDLVLRLTSGTHIKLKTLASKTMTLEFDGPDPIKRVYANIQDKEGIKGLVLDNYKIENESTLNLEFCVSRKMEIKVKTWWCGGEDFTLGVESSNTTEIVKNKIQEKTGICTNDMRLIFQGIQLVDERTLADYNIEEDNLTLNLVIRLCGGFEISKRRENKNAHKCLRISFGNLCFIF